MLPPPVSSRTTDEPPPPTAPTVINKGDLPLPWPLPTSVQLEGRVCQATLSKNREAIGGSSCQEGGRQQGLVKELREALRKAESVVLCNESWLRFIEEVDPLIPTMPSELVLAVSAFLTAMMTNSGAKFWPEVVAAASRSNYKVHKGWSFQLRRSMNI